MRRWFIKYMFHELLWVYLVLWVRRDSHEPSPAISNQPWMHFESWAVIRVNLDILLFVGKRLKWLYRLQLQVLIRQHLILRSLSFFLITSLEFLVLLFLFDVLLIELKSKAAWSLLWLFPLVHLRHPPIAIWGFTVISLTVCIYSLENHSLARGKPSIYRGQRLTSQGHLRLHLTSFFLFFLQVRFLFPFWRRLKLDLLVLLF